MRAQLPRRLQLLDADLRRDPYDVDAWLSMLADLSARHADLAAPFFDLCLQYFPTSVRAMAAGRVRGPLRGLQMACLCRVSPNAGPAVGHVRRLGVEVEAVRPCGTHF